MKKKKVLFILGSGGHTAQMLELSKDLKNKINYVYLIQKDDELSENKIIYPGKVIYINRAAVLNRLKLYVYIYTIINFFKAIKIIKKNKIDVLISAGPGIAISFFYAGKLLNKKLIFIESWSRVISKSKSGRLIYPITNLFFVQWRDNLQNYPKALYRGRFR